MHIRFERSQLLGQLDETMSIFALPDAPAVRDRKFPDAVQIFRDNRRAGPF